MRTALNMRKGKMIAQGAHASQKVFFDRMWNPKWESEEEFAEILAEETMEIPKHLIYYIDYEKLARDLFIND